MSRILAAAVVLALLTAAMPVSAEQVLRRGNQVEPETLDPQRAESISALNILRDLYEGLTTEAADGRIVPGVAESWEVSDDGLTYDFHLRADARWSNGDPVTAQDFVNGIRRSVDPATGSNVSSILSVIRNADAIIDGRLPVDRLGVSAPDSTTVRIELASPAPYLPGLLTHASTYPIHRSSLAHGQGRFSIPGQLVSNGAYQLSDWQVQSHITLTRNPYFHDAAKVAIDKVIYYPIDNQSSELKRYLAGELDWTYDIPVTQVHWIRDHLPGELVFGPYLGSYFYGFNLKRPPFKDQPGLRQALAMVIDRKVITEKLLGAGELPALGWVPTGVQGYAGQQVSWADWPMSKRLDEARRLYAAAGYSAQHPLQVEIRYNSYNDHRRIALAVAWMWKQALGVQTHLVNEEWKVFLQNRRAGLVTQVFRGSWVGDYNDPSTFLNLLQSDNGKNDMGYDNPEYDQLLQQAAQQRDPAQREQTLQQAERLMLGDMPVLPIYFYVSHRLIKPYVKGWQANIMDHHATRYLRLDGAPLNAGATPTVP